MTVDAVAHAPRTPPKIANQLVALLLRSPFHRPISKTLMLLTFTGRKSGKAYTLPIGYMREGTTVLCFTDHAWWKNLLDRPTVTLYLQGQKLRGRAEVVSDDREAIANKLQAFVQRSPNAARAYGVTIDANGLPNRESVLRAAQRFRLIRIHLA